MLRFQLGAVGSAPAVQWTAAITTTNLGNGTAIDADTVLNGGPGATGNQVYYRLISNLGGGNNVSISATGVGGGLTSGVDTIPYSEIVGTATDISGGAVATPPEGSSTTVTPTAGVIDREGYWNYSFANTTFYPAGTYGGTINYTATHTP